LSEPSFLHYSHPLQCEEHNAEVDAVLNVRWAEIDAKFGQAAEAKFGQAAEPPAALAAVETTPDAPGGPVEQGAGGDGAGGATPAAPGVSVEPPPTAPGVPVEHGAGGDGAGGATPAAPGVSVEPPPTASAAADEPAPTASAANEIFKFCGICTMPKPPDSCVSCPKCRDNVIKTEITPCEGCQLLAQQANPDATLCEKHAQLFDVVFLKARALTAADDGSAKGSAEVDKRTAIQ
jgi:hypothetical protein